MRATNRRGETSTFARRLTHALTLALYMTDPIRQGTDERLVARYLGELESNLRGPIVAIAYARTARKER
ncbi:hypothetical protein QF001_006753 [Paraburkholderia youngii]|uniref:Uncharacterized protein n=1 Tax=Paraburkholderia youngii TaxID=2782701 RepID=A0A7Y6K0B6_9BURK|nr:hypothetical protein [Paraburkholderia youngii]NUY01506.1 hypothetical protein [Paraburkholderia youngii]